RDDPVGGRHDELRPGRLLHHRPDGRRRDLPEQRRRRRRQRRPDLADRGHGRAELQVHADAPRAVTDGVGAGLVDLVPHRRAAGGIRQRRCVGRGDRGRVQPVRGHRCRGDHLPDFPVAKRIGAGGEGPLPHSAHNRVHAGSIPAPAITPVEDVMRNRPLLLLTALALVAAPSCSPPAADAAPVLRAGPIDLGGFLAPGDSLGPYTFTVPAVPGATGYSWTLTTSGTNGVWSNVPTGQATASPTLTFTLASGAPWDSVSLQ